MRRELIRRLEELEKAHSKASPGMINRALQRLSEGGKRPTDPAVVQIVQRIRLFQIEIELTTGASGPEDALQRLDFNPTEKEEAWARWRWQWRPGTRNIPG